MEEKPKLLFVFDHPKEEWWMDGLSAALDLLSEDFEIIKLNIHNPPEPQDWNIYDFILGWGAFGSSVDKLMQSKPTGGNARNITMGLCIAGNSFPPEGANNYDILFYETDWTKDIYLRGVTTKTKRAFGVNTDIFFSHNVPNPIVWDYIGVGAFASWKRWEKMKSKPGNRLVVGEYQMNNEKESLSIIRDLMVGRVMTSPMVNPYDLSNFYQWSRTLYMPSDLNGGGERAVLEARSCGLNVEVEDDNPKLKELTTGPIPSHIYYAKQLKEGILSVL